MAQGPGKYDDLCTLVRERAQAQGVILLVLGGHHGEGFSVQCLPTLIAAIPVLLRDLATEIERQS